MSEDVIKEIQAAIDSVKPIHIWIISYGITHSYLVLHIHSGNYPRGLKLECSDCFYISGKTQYGPYDALKIEIKKDNSGEDLVVISADDDRFVVKCGSINLSELSKT